MIIRNIFTGGTIGSHLNENGVISASQNAPYKLIELYKEYCGSRPLAAQFINSEPYCILSENLTAHTLLKLIAAVGAQLEEALQSGDTDGILIMHGTDTLSYSAAILGYIFGASPIPAVLVSSDYVLSDSRANGLINYAFAVDFIQNQKGRGVFVSYCNKNGVPTIHRATRLQPPVPYSADVSSVKNTWFGRYPQYRSEAADKTVHATYCSNPLYKTVSGNISHIGALSNLQYRDIKLTGAAKDILRIPCYPGMAYPSIPAGTKAILHESYHSGTIAINDNLKRFADQAAKRNIPIYLSGLAADSAEYETVDMYRELGIIPLKDSSLVASYCKLWLAASNHLDIPSVMNVSVAEDFV